MLTLARFGITKNIPHILHNLMLPRKPWSSPHKIPLPHTLCPQPYIHIHNHDLLLITLFFTFMLAKLLLWKFTFKPDANSKHLRIVFNVMHSLGDSLKKIVSSTNWRSDIFILALPSDTPVMNSLAFVYLTKPLKPSATTKKRSDAKGSPCQRPFCAMNSSVGFLLTNTEMDDFCRQDHIHWIYFLPNPSEITYMLGNSTQPNDKLSQNWPWK